MKEISIGILIGLIISTSLYIFYKSKKTKKKYNSSKIDHKWIELNKHIIGMEKNKIVNLLGEGTHLKENKLLYLSEWENIGRIQNIYSFNQREELEAIELKIQKENEEVFVKAIIDLLGEYEILDEGIKFWRVNELEYILSYGKDLLQLYIKKG